MPKSALRLARRADLFVPRALPSRRLARLRARAFRSVPDIAQTGAGCRWADRRYPPRCAPCAAPTWRAPAGNSRAWPRSRHPDGHTAVQAASPDAGLIFGRPRVVTRVPLPAACRNARAPASATGRCGAGSRRCRSGTKRTRRVCRTRAPRMIMSHRCMSARSGARHCPRNAPPAQIPLAAPPWLG